METVKAEPETKETESKHSVDPVELQKKIEELLNENASRRIKNKELNDQLGEFATLKEQIEANKKKELEEQGKYKELLEDRETKLKEMLPLADKVKKYEEVLSKDLEKEIETLPETLKKMISESGKDKAEQLEMARSLRAELGQSTSSPGTERPGGDVATQDVQSLVDKYRVETDMNIKMGMLYDIKAKFPEVYKKL